MIHLTFQVDVRELDCDFLVGSAHKIYGPTGIGFLYAKRSILDSMKPWKGGSGMIKVLLHSTSVIMGRASHPLALSLKTFHIALSQVHLR